MVFYKEETFRRARFRKATLILLAGSVLLAVLYAGCTLFKPSGDPEGTASSSETVLEEKSNYSKYSAGFTTIEGNVSKYELGPLDDREAPEVVVSGKYVYFLCRVSGKYEIKKINIEDPSDSGIAKIDGDEEYFCLLSDYGVRVENKDEVIFMDLELNVICSVPNKEDIEYIAPYKDSYIVLQGDDLSILKDGKLEPFRRLNQNGYVVMNQQITEDNTRLLLNDNNNNHEGQFCFYIYDVNADKYTEVKNMGFNYSADGFYDITPKRIMVRKLTEDQEQEYENKYPGNIATSFFDGERLYLCDEGDLTIRYYDPFRQTICSLSDHEFARYGVNFRGLSGKKLFFILNSELYVIDTASCEELPVEEFNIVLHGKIEDLSTEIRDKYSVNFQYGKDAAKEIRDNVEVTELKEETRVLYSMKKISEYIRRFGKEFFDDFRYGTSKGLYVLLGGYTQVTNDGAKIDAGGVAFRQGDVFYIVLNVTNDDPARNFCHEIMHSMEHNTDSDTIFSEWKKYNPNGFKYADSYAAGTDEKYTLYGPDEEEKYFIDSYSKTNALEDRARIFENMLATTKEECQINDYPHIRAKANYMRERLCKLYPSLKNTDIFRNLDG